MNYFRVIKKCHKNISSDILKTPLQLNDRLSDFYKTKIYFKREDLQTTRSFKLRGALNKIKHLDNCSKIICASAGNHAQGVAYSCNKLGINGDIYVPSKTPLQKINRIRYYGKNNVNIFLSGQNFDQCLEHAKEKADSENIELIHPFNDTDIINGQATIAYEIFEDIKPDFILCAVGGGGLISGVSKFSKNIDYNTKIIGIEPKGAESLKLAFDNKHPIKIHNIDNFVDGASVSIVGDKTYDISKQYVDKLYTISNEELCHEIINCYQDDGIILEPAGALSISCLKYLNKDYNLKNKKIVCILSGGNNDLTRYDEIMDLNLKYLKLKHYFLLEFSQRPGELKLFINNILGPDDDIIRFEYIKKTNRNYGKVLIGIELSKKDNIKNIENNLNKFNFKYKKVDTNDLL